MSDTAAPAESAAGTPEEIVARLTLEEKASLTSGEGMWHTKSVDRVGLPAIMLTDGPHGVRKERAEGLGLRNAVPATCFPPAVALGATFDPELLERVGVALGEEAVAEEVGVLLGPGINIKRTPLCGRNFEYLSEDPLVAGTLGAALVRGLQSQGVGASVKHFAANNQESDRMRVSADIDPRALREFYLRGFQRVVTEAQPWTVMCSYNRINGTYASEDPWLLTSVLRDEWGFDGLVMSDWGAVNDRVSALVAGLDLEMPASGGRTDAEIVAAVGDGRLDEAVLDRGAARVVSMVQKAVSRSGSVAAQGDSSALHGAAYDAEAHHALAREAAGRSVVLLTNDGILPLERSQSVAVIGAFAKTPRFQGAGSSFINPTQLDSALGAIMAQAGEESIGYAAGFVLDDDADAGVLAERLVAEAAALAGSKDVAVVFLGLPDSRESEGFDRPDIELPVEQLKLLDAVVAENPRTVVVLSNGSVVRLGEVVDRAAAVVEGWLLGQAGGSATADVLYGDVNPSGRLAETIPVRLQDSPAFLDFPGERGHVRYGEGLFVGYRWYDARELDVAFPFGHGLSYTTFDYSGLSLTADEGGVDVTLTVTNTGSRDGREVVQAYVSLAESVVARAPQELKGFASVALAAGESREVTVRLRREDLAVWDVRVDRWVVEGGTYAVAVGASSRDLRVSGTVEVPGDDVQMPFSLDSSIAEILADPIASAVIADALGAGPGASEEGGHKSMLADPEMLTLVGSAPIGRIVAFPGMTATREQVAELLEQVNVQRGAV
ncbi:MAG: glycoside hydrolase family 3 C-terminal domain-containing protein [Terracoccus sp.]